jgi:hypothetical protein
MLFSGVNVSFQVTFNTVIIEECITIANKASKFSSMVNMRFSPRLS